MCVVLADGRVQCSGSFPTFSNSTFTTVAGLSGPAVSVAVSAASGTPTDSSSNAACALLADGSIQCLGAGYGNGTTPVTITGLRAAAKQVVVGDSHACALLSDGTVQCWGSNFAGQLGDGTFKGSATAVNVIGLNSVTAIAAGDAHTCATSAAHSVACWGDNESGELGDGTNVDSPTPVEVLLH
jgi:hypothetical protein